MKHTAGPRGNKAPTCPSDGIIEGIIQSGPRAFFLTSPMVDRVAAKDPKWRRPMHTAKLHYVADSIIRQRLGVARSGRTKYVNLHSKVLEQFCTWRFSKDAVMFLIASGVIESDYEYLPGMKATGYRLTEAAWRGGFCLSPIPDGMVKKYNDVHRGLRKKKTEKLKAEGVSIEYLEAHLNRLELSGGWAANHLASAYEKASVSNKWQDGEAFHSTALSIAAVMKREWIFTRCRAGRLHYLLTNISKGIRRQLRYEGQRLIECDVSSCQPLIAASLYGGDTASVQEKAVYLEFVLSGRFYEDLATRAGYSQGERKKLKQDVLKWIFFGGVTYTSRNGIKLDHPLWVAFRDLFPILSRVLLFSKAEIQHHNTYKGDSQLAMRLQHEEATIFIDRVLTRLAVEYPNVPAFPVHDCMMTTAENADLIIGLIREEFVRKLGISPRVDCGDIAA